MERPDTIATMTNGLGAGFAALSLVGLLAGLALLLCLATAGALVLSRRTGRTPRLLGFLALGVLVGVVGVAGFGVLALSDEAPLVAGILLVTVFLPLAVTGGRVRRATGAAWLDVLATTAMAWALPFLVGVGVLLGTWPVAAFVLGLTPGTSQQSVVGWVAATAAGVVVVAGTLSLGSRLGTVPDGDVGRVTLPTGADAADLGRTETAGFVLAGVGVAASLVGLFLTFEPRGGMAGVPLVLFGVALAVPRYRRVLGLLAALSLLSLPLAVLRP